MKERYLIDLKNALEEKGIFDNYHILDKYERRYNLGREAGLPDSDIEDMLGTPEDVANKYFVEGFKEETGKEAEDNTYEYSKFNVTISTVADNIEIIYEDIPKPFYETNDLDLYNYDILDTSDEFRFQFKKMRFLALFRKSGNVVIHLPIRNLNRLSIHSTEGNIKINGKVMAKDFDIEAISGCIKLGDIESAYANIKTVSGNISCNNLYTLDATCGTVSGNIEINYVKASELRLESISGSIIINEANASVNSTTISGNVIVNGKEFGNNIKNKVRDFFK